MSAKKAKKSVGRKRATASKPAKGADVEAKKPHRTGKSSRSNPVVAFLGLGRMGQAMAARLLVASARDSGVSGSALPRGAAGRPSEVRVWNRTARRAEPLRKLGAVVAKTPRACVEGADVVVTMLADKDALAEVLVGDDGLLSGLGRGTVVVDMSTIGRAGAIEAARVVKSAGARFVDAPVSGTVGPARAGTLVALVGGAAADVSRVEPVLLRMCSRVLRAGGVGQGQALKVILNGVGSYHFVGFAAMLTLGLAAGLDRKVIVDAFTTGAFASPSYVAKKSKVLAKDWSADFTLALALKDALLNGDLQRETKTPIPSQQELVRAMADAVDDGLGDLDLFGIERHFSRR